MTRPRRVAHRTIPVAVAAPVQLPLALAWEHPVDRVATAPTPTPTAPAVQIRRAA